MSIRLASRAWVAAGLFDCHTGLLELGDGELRFVTDDGRRLFAAPAGRARVRFPWWLVDGLVVSEDGVDHTVLLSDPYAYGSAGASRATRERWRQAFPGVPSARRPSRPRPSRGLRVARP